MARASGGKASGAEDQTVDIGGRRIKLTNLDKVMYPEARTTKADVIDYYARIAPVMLPHLADRPITRKRWVHGVGIAEHPGQVFFQKNLDQGTPSWVKRRTIQHKSGPNDYPIANDLATLVWLAQLAALELHVPQWRFGRTGVQKNPDRLVLDLDPGPGVGLAECAEVARLAKAILDGMGLSPMPVTSGSKGIHLYAALDGKLGSDQVSAVAHELARALEADHPDLVVSDMKKSLREGRVLVDWSQNNANKTTICPYSLRGRARPTVAVPRTWEELDDPDLAQLEYPEVLERAAEGDPLAGLTAGHLASLEPTPARLAGFEHAGGPDRLAKYRSMRDGAKTPEPVPDGPPGPPGAAGGGAPVFVIQEHHASRLHWDFRLEHDGVLVSWALPRGVPTDPGKNHLAVQTEDHPIEYGSFEGTIPGGQYGAGEVTIWDAGTYELEKWIEGKEVIAVLHGERQGTVKYALIHTGGRGGDQENNWLIHRMADPVIHEYGPDWKPKPAKGKPLTGTGLRGGGRKVIGRKAGAKLPAPMLASPADQNLADQNPGTAVHGAGDPAEWAYEMKWDGIRAITEVRDGMVRALSRNGIDITGSYPELEAMAGALKADSAVLDGEIVALNRRGRPDFGLLQSRMGVTRAADVERVRGKAPIHYIVFDLLELDDRDLTALPYHERRELLEERVRVTGPVQVAPAFEGDLDAALSTSRELGLEGVLAKRLDSRYTPGRRSRSWVKLKHVRTQEVVVGGWMPGKGNRANRVGSLLLGIPDPDAGTAPGGAAKLRFVGKVGTGFTDRQLDQLTRTMTGLERKTSPFAELPAAEARDARFVTPKRVAEVEFAEWTAGGRLRAPTWRGWRTDKDAAEVVAEP